MLNQIVLKIEKLLVFNKQQKIKKVYTNFLFTNGLLENIIAKVDLKQFQAKLLEANKLALVDSIFDLNVAKIGCLMHCNQSLWCVINKNSW